MVMIRVCGEAVQMGPTGRIPEHFRFGHRDGLRPGCFPALQHLLPAAGAGVLPTPGSAPQAPAAPCGPSGYWPSVVQRTIRPLLVLQQESLHQKPPGLGRGGFLQRLCQDCMYVLAISLRHDVFVSLCRLCNRADTSPRMGGKDLACRAARLLRRELVVRPAYPT